MLALEYYDYAFKRLRGIMYASRLAAERLGVSYTRFANTLRFLGLWTRGEDLSGELVEGWLAGKCQCTLRLKYEPRKKKSSYVEGEITITYPYPVTYTTCRKVCECIFDKAAVITAAADIAYSHGLIETAEAFEELYSTADKEEIACEPVEYPTPFTFVDPERPKVLVSMWLEYRNKYRYETYDVVIDDLQVYRSVLSCIEAEGEPWIA
jgi:hypothetical protein